MDVGLFPFQYIPLRSTSSIVLSFIYPFDKSGMIVILTAFTIMQFFLSQSVQIALIYLTLAAFNLGLPLFWVIVFIYLSIEMSGFPFSTVEAKFRLQSLSKLGMGWSLARFMWGCVALTSVLEGWMDQFQDSKISYTIVLVAFTT